MQEVLFAENLSVALRQVQGNKGSPGIDGMTVTELPAHRRPGRGPAGQRKFEPRLTTAKAQLARLQSALQLQVDQEAQALRLVAGHLEAFAKQVATGPANADWNTRRDVNRALVKRVERQPEQVKVINRVDIHRFDSRFQGGVLHYCCRRDGLPVRENQISNH